VKYNREDIESQLVRHQVDYSPPGAGRSTWRVRVEGEMVEMTNRDVHFYLLGRDDVFELLQSPAFKAQLGSTYRSLKELDRSGRAEREARS
jgi:hypothetical protein